MIIFHGAMRKRLGILAVFALAAACGGPQNSPQSRTQNSAANASRAARVYEAILNCDGGAAVVDKNTLSPKYPQLVIRNPEIVSYLASKGVTTNQRSEVILIGENDRPVFQSSDFHGFTDLGSGTYRNDWVRREGAGVRVAFNRFEYPANSDCGRDIPATDPGCRGRFVEIANWSFQRCR